ERGTSAASNCGGGASDRIASTISRYKAETSSASLGITIRHESTPYPALGGLFTPTDPRAPSPRRHCTSPRRGRLVEWSHQRPGNVRLPFRARRSPRRRASDAGYESVGYAESIDVTTSDIPLRTDSVKRCKG